MSVAITSIHSSPFFLPLKHTCSKSQGKDNDQSTDICLWLSPLPGLPFLCLLGTAGAGQECLCLGLFRSPPWLALEGLCLLPVGPEHRPHPWGAAACTLHRPHFAQTKCLGREWTRHSLENMNFQGTVEPRTHHRLQNDPATLAKQVAPLQCFSRGQRAA